MWHSSVSSHTGGGLYFALSGCISVSFPKCLTQTEVRVLEADKLPCRAQKNDFLVSKGGFYFSLWASCGQQSETSDSPKLHRRSLQPVLQQPIRHQNTSDLRIPFLSDCTSCSFVSGSLQLTHDFLSFLLLFSHLSSLNLGHEALTTLPEQSGLYLYSHASSEPPLCAIHGKRTTAPFCAKFSKPAGKWEMFTTVESSFCGFKLMVRSRLDIRCKQ